ncbi:hypothetical protein [Enterococcus villorum]|nr:hypothetical protein [Enterococcus villorum]
MKHFKSISLFLIFTWAILGCVTSAQSVQASVTNEVGITFVESEEEVPKEENVSKGSSSENKLFPTTGEDINFYLQLGGIIILISCIFIYFYLITEISFSE